MGCVAVNGEQTLTLRCALLIGNRRYNESNTLIYANARELLEAGSPMTYEAYPLWQTDYELVQSRSYQGYEIYKSINTYPVSGGTALVAEGNHWEKQPTYGLTQAQQYSVDSDGHIWVVLSKHDLDGTQSPDEVLENLGATLYAFEP